MGKRTVYQSATLAWASNHPLEADGIFFFRSISYRHILFLLIVLGNVALMLRAAQILLYFPYSDLSWSKQADIVSVVEARGMLAAGGAHPGDQILTVDGYTAEKIDQIYFKKQVGDQIAFTLQQADQTRNVSFTFLPLSFQARLERINPILVALAFWSMSILILILRSDNDAVTNLFFLVSQFASGTLTSGALSTIQWPWSSQIFTLLLLLLAPLTLHFYIYFPNRLRFNWCQPLLGIAYVITGLLVLVTLISPLLPLPPAYLLILWTIRRSFIGLILITAITLLFFRSDTDPLQIRQRHRLLSAGTIVSITPMLLLSFVPELIGSAPIVDYAWTFPFLILMPIIYTYTVCQEQLGRIDRLLNRSLVYTLLAFMLIGIYLLSSVGLRRILPQQPWTSALLDIGLALGVAVCFAPTQVQLQKLVDRLFYGGWYNYRTVVRGASAELNRAIDMHRLVAQLITVAQVMRFYQAALLWNEGDKITVKRAFGYSPEVLALFQLPVAATLTRYLQAAAQPRLCTQLAQDLGQAELAASERTLVELSHAHLWLPLVSRGRLYGVVVMGHRQGDVPLDREDMDILITLAGQAAIAAENVVLLETLRARLQDMERMQNKLAEAQHRLAEGCEQERLHLAQELHDGPVQDLYGMGFELELLLEEAPAASVAAQLMMLQETVKYTAQTLRAICGALRPPALADFGLEVAIRSHADLYRKKHPGLDIHLDLMCDGQALPERVRLALFRIYQETLNNIAQHAQASSVIVRLRLDSEHAVLEVHDNGRGFIVPESWIEPAREGHLGLLGAWERATYINGRLEVSSVIDQGTIVRVIAPGALPQSAVDTTPTELALHDSDTNSRSSAEYSGAMRDT